MGLVYMGIPSWRDPTGTLKIPYSIGLCPRDNIPADIYLRFVALRHDKGRNVCDLYNDQVLSLCVL